MCYTSRREVNDMADREIRKSNDANQLRLQEKEADLAKLRRIVETNPDKQL